MYEDVKIFTSAGGGRCEADATLQPQAGLWPQDIKGSVVLFEAPDDTEEVRGSSPRSPPAPIRQPAPGQPWMM